MTEFRGYVICSTARSGSNYLCSILKQTGVLGNPTEYFNVDDCIEQFGSYPTDPVQQIDKVLELGSTPNGVYGLKVFPYQADQIEASNWQSALPDLRWIYLERTDILAQAVSWARANQTGQWRARHTVAKAEPTFDAAMIAGELANIAIANARWNLFFAINDIEPLRLTYETIAADPKPAVQAVADIMDVELPADFVVQSEERVQRDGLNAAWAEAFKARYGNINRLPRFG